MKAIKNISGSDLSVDFSFDTYSFPSDQALLVNEDVFNHLQEMYPLAFDFDFKGAKTLPKVKRTKTPVRMAPGTDDSVDMKAEPAYRKPTTFGTVDDLPVGGQSDKDGVEYYGEGAVIT